MSKVKHIILFFVIVLSIFFVGCTENSKHFKVGVVQYRNDTWRGQTVREIEQEMSFYKDMDLVFKSANGNSDRQYDLIREFIDQEVDMIIVISGETNYDAAIIEEAYDKGIKVVIVDNAINVDKYTAFLGADNAQIGGLIGEYIATNFVHGCRVLEITGVEDTNVTKERHNGFVESLSGRKDIEIVGSIDCLWLEEKAKSVVDSMLMIYPDIDVIYAHSDEMAYGAYQSIKLLNRDIKLIGINAFAGQYHGLDLVSREILDVSFLYPTFGNIVMQRAHEILHGLPYERITRFDTALITPNNARVELLKLDQLNELDRRIKSLNISLDNNRRTNMLQRYLLLLVSVVVVASVIAVVIIIRILKSKERMNKQLKSQNVEIMQQRDKLVELSQELTEATNAKLQFYTNISHDLRTPLTLINDPVNYILKSSSLDSEHRSLLDIASRNISILLRLIDQILDFRSNENDKLELMLSQCNIEQKIKEWSANFQSTLQQRGKDISLHVAPDANYTIMFDSEKVERIYFNLLSNAIKYSNDEQDIQVRLWSEIIDDRAYVCFSVKNGCKQLLIKDVNTIFDRFYQVDKSSYGFGIGLAISKSYSELHGGKIWADGGDNSITISVALPCNVQPNAENNNNLDDMQYIIASTVDEKHPITLPSEDVNSDDDRAVILIVDDNRDIRQYVNFLLSKSYVVIMASDGEEAQKLAMEHIPDLIISDIMMSQMNGIELCNKIKGELLTCHIPVVLLTAYAADEHRIEGYESGADGYISKPFNSDVLLSRVSNLIAGRKLLKGVVDEPVKIREGALPEEHSLLSQFNSYIDSHLGDSQLGVDELAREMNYSRAQLHRKIKALTGESPNRLLRNARLQRANELIRTTMMSISEIGYEVGFTSPSYFTKSYKEYYGTLPSCDIEEGRTIS